MLFRAVALFALVASAYGACPEVPAGACAVCGAGKCISQPDVTVSLNGQDLLCKDVQQAGLDANPELVPFCSFLPGLIAGCVCNDVGVAETPTDPPVDVPAPTDAPVPATEAPITPAPVTSAPVADTEAPTPAPTSPPTPPPTVIASKPTKKPSKPTKKPTKKPTRKPTRKPTAKKAKKGKRLR